MGKSIEPPNSEGAQGFSRQPGLPSLGHRFVEPAGGVVALNEGGGKLLTGVLSWLPTAGYTGTGPRNFLTSAVTVVRARSWS